MEPHKMNLAVQMPKVYQFYGWIEG